MIDCSGLGLLPQVALDEYQVGQGRERVEMLRVLRQAAVAHLAVAEEVFDDIEGST